MNCEQSYLLKLCMLERPVVEVEFWGQGSVLKLVLFDFHWLSKEPSKKKASFKKTKCFKNLSYQKVAIMKNITKGQSRNFFFKPTVPPKNARMNSTLLLWYLLWYFEINYHYSIKNIWKIWMNFDFEIDFWKPYLSSFWQIVWKSVKVKPKNIFLDLIFEKIYSELTMVLSDQFVKSMVFCYQNWSDLLWDKIVRVIEKNFWNSRLKAENLQNFWDH